MGDYCYICSDYLYECDYVCEAPDEESLMNQVSDHFAKEHDHAHLDAETKAKIKNVIKKPDK